MAGASQSHKHLQLVPLPFVPEQSGAPVDPMLAAAEFDGKLGRVSSLPFAHVFARVDPDWLASPSRAAQAGAETYQAMFRALRQPGPYNLLVTRSWMLLVPRSRESFRGVSVNALGFAGSLLVKNQRELRLVREVGPMTILSEVGIASV